MSTDPTTATAEPTPSKKHKSKHKDKDGERSSKKRKHHTTTSTSADVTQTPSKRSRTTDTHTSSPAPPAAAPSSPPTNTSATLSQKPTFTTSDTPFFTQTTSLYLPLSPIGQRNPLESLCAEHLSPLILTYYPPLKGIILSYSNPSLSELQPTSTASIPTPRDDPPILARTIAEYAPPYTWLTATFTLLRPARGAEVEGYVTVQSPNHIGLVCWNLFSASIERRRLPKEWSWSGGPSSASAVTKAAGAATGAATTANGTEAGAGAEPGAQREGSAQPQDDTTDGFFVDGSGQKVTGLLKFRILDFDVAPEMVGREKGFTSIEGTMLDDEEEGRIMREVERKAGKKRRARGTRRLPEVVDVEA